MALTKAEKVTCLLGYAEITLTTVDPPSRLASPVFLVRTHCCGSAVMALLLSFMNMPPSPPDALCKSRRLSLWPSGDRAEVTHPGGSGRIHEIVLP